MRYLAICTLLLLCLVASVSCQESEDKDNPDRTGKKTWWENFKQRVKMVLSKWREDIKILWDDVMAKADDMKGWTSDMLDSFKRKVKEWLETRPVPDDEKNEIETFINKLKVPTEKPTPKSKIIDP